ncbi:MAG: SIS domain-containing protein, partial [Actinomycetota bacterium]
PTLLGMSADDPVSVFLRPLDLLGRPEDIAIGLSPAKADPGGPAVAAGLKQAEAKGFMTMGLSGPGETLAAAGPGWLFRCDDEDPDVVQEVHETLYHVLWELVHVFFDHRGLLEENPGGTRHDVGHSAFLYPFLSATEKGLDSVLEHVRSSILLKSQEVIEVRSQQMGRPQELVQAARVIAERVRRGGKVLTFGNGGSATDAQDFATDLMLPPTGMKPVPALSLTNEEAVVTAVANDVGFDNVFARQIIAYGEPEDVAVGISTSGGSHNHLSALAEARRRGLATIALVGYGGGETVVKKLADLPLVIDHDYIPRIQEAQATQYHLIRRLIDRIVSEN